MSPITLTLILAASLGVIFLIVKVRKIIISILNQHLIELGKYLEKECCLEEFQYCVEESYNSSKYKLAEQIAALDLKNPDARFLTKRNKSLFEEGRLKGELFKNFSSLEYDINHIFYMNGLRIRRQEFLITTIACLAFRAFCYKNCIKPIVLKHLKTLLRKKKYLVTQDDYGNDNYDHWHNEKKNFYEKCIKRDLENYFLNLAQPFFQVLEKIFKQKMTLSKFLKKPNETNFIVGDWLDVAIYIDDICYIEKMKEPNETTQEIISRFREVTDGYEYERFIKDLLLEIGCENARLTKASGDQGADVIAEFNNIKICIQCKFYTSTIGNSAVQEAFSAKNFYDCDIAAVTSNAQFSQSAIQLAKKIDVKLLHHENLENFITNLKTE